MTSPRIQAVFFDLDGTLCRFDDDVYGEVLDRVSTELGARYGLDATRLAQLHRDKSIDHWRNLSAGVFTAKNGSRDGEQIMLDIWVDALEAAGCSDERAARTGHDAYWAARDGIFALYDDSLEVLQRLHGRLPLVIITNGPADLQEDKLQVLGIAPYVDLIVSSGAHGIGKPDPAIFQIALDHLRIEPAAAWHVGDNLFADVGGAKSAGLKAAWLNRTGAILSAEDPRPDAELTSLRELPALLGI
jgi:putative hydrolase of the HAD superfamily